MIKLMCELLKFRKSLSKIFTYNSWAMGSYNKIILLAFMILPLVTGSLAVGGLQTAYGGGGPGECDAQGAGTPCGEGSSGVCDNPDTCDGFGTCKSNFKSSITPCRSQAGICDEAETCTGNSAVCPGDAFLIFGTVCRPSSGVCDVEEACTGSSVSCPGDVFLAGGTVCDPGSGDLCDPDETCTGSSATCPTDTFESSSFVCREGSGDVCDPDEFCPGVADQMCPADVVAASGTPCSCSNGAGTCDGSGTCFKTAAVDIKFGSDPNCIKKTSRGVIPVVILGSDSFNVSDIDVSSLEIDDDATPGGGVAPVKDAIKDVDGDSFDDLVLKFKTSDLNTAVLLTDGNVLTITGVFLDGTPFVGDDVIFLAGMSSCF